MRGGGWRGSSDFALCVRVYVRLLICCFLSFMNPGTQTSQRLFSENLLAQYDGTDPEKPVFIAVGHSCTAMCRHHACTREAYHEWPDPDRRGRVRCQLQPSNLWSWWLLSYDVRTRAVHHVDP